MLEAAGYRVEIPPRVLCCGRPLYDYGMLDLAKKVLRQSMDALRPWVEQGVPIVGLEPSCVAVFRDELKNLFPGENVPMVLLSEFLSKNNCKLPALKRRAIVQAHCHQKSVLGMADEQAVMSRLGLDYRVLDSGCCGMAGAFGFEHYDVSMKCAERVLLPEVREAPQDSLIVANGFSCREQIVQGTGRRALHLAEAIRMGLRGSSIG